MFRWTIMLAFLSACDSDAPKTQSPPNMTPDGDADADADADARLTAN